MLVLAFLLTFLTVGRGLFHTDPRGPGGRYYQTPSNPWGISGPVQPRRGEHKEGGVYTLTVLFDGRLFDLAVELDVFKKCTPGTDYPECGYGNGPAALTTKGTGT